MDMTKRRQIAKIAETIYVNLGLHSPVDVKAVSQELRGEVIEADLPEELDARIEKAGDAFKIVFNSNKPDTRNNFSIAHELGHLFLHLGYLINPEKWKSVNTYTDSVYHRFGHGEEELEANEFAAAFLMPEKEYREVVDKNKKNDHIDISKVAKHFGVSVEAALNRGRWLGIFPWE